MLLRQRLWLGRMKITEQKYKWEMTLKEKIFWLTESHFAKNGAKWSAKSCK